MGIWVSSPSHVPLPSDDGGRGRRGDGADGVEEDEDGVRGRSASSSCDVCAVVLENMGANRNLAKLFYSSPSSGGAGVRCYVLDCHRPYHLANVPRRRGPRAWCSSTTGHLRMWRS